MTLRDSIASGHERDAHATHLERQPIADTGQRRRRLAFFIVIALILVYVGQAIAASWNKSSTFDEPVHALSSHLIVTRGDFRVNAEHPSLWKYVPGLASIGMTVSADLDEELNTPAANELLKTTESQWWWAVDVLYGADHRSDLGERLVARQRIAMSLFALATAVLVARWAWAAGGALASILATALLSFDPNFIAHGALVTNDVAATSCFIAAGYFTWRLGTRFSWRRAAGLIAVCAIAAGVKFTCVLLGPMVMVPLLVRALVLGDWPTGAAAIASRGRRLAIVVGVGVAAAIAAVVLLWPAYQFRWSATRDGAIFDTAHAARTYAYNAISLDAGAKGLSPTDAQIKAQAEHYPMPASARFVRWLGERHLVPQAWSYGVLYAQSRSLGRPAYLLGEISDGGSIWYFPVAVLSKTPTATLLILFFAGCAVIANRRPSRFSQRAVWLCLCLLLPAAIYFGVALFSHLNIGVRHVLPVAPPLFVAAGVVLAPIIARSIAARRTLIVAFAALVIETTLAFPNDLNFFNAPSKLIAGSELSLLGDSNLDWGQDLPALARFYKDYHAANPGRPFYLCYFGTPDPRVYGIDSINALGGYPFDRTPPVQTIPRNGGLLAISASYLQGTYAPQYGPMMTQLRASEPYAVINGTIYIYALPDR